MSKTNTTAATTSSRKRYAQEYKSEAMKLADRLGVGVAAKQLGIDPSQLYAWRGKATRAAARAEITEYNEIFYNRLQRHSKLGNLSPAVFAQQARMQPTIP